jgi:formylglycine-generating enzyme required for sulfatase activity
MRNRLLGFPLLLWFAGILIDVGMPLRAVAVQTTVRAVGWRPSPVGLATDIQLHLGNISSLLPPLGQGSLGVINAPALISTLHQRITAPEATPGQVYAGLVLMRVLSEPKHLSGVEEYLRLAEPKSQADPAHIAIVEMGRWSSVLRGNPQARQTIARAVAPLQKTLSTSGRFDSEAFESQAKTLFDGTLSRKNETLLAERPAVFAGRKSPQVPSYTRLKPYDPLAKDVDQSPRREIPAPMLSAAERQGTTVKTLWEEHEAAGLPPFQNIVIDVRGSRGGRGDVAAGYLVATDILERARRAKTSAPSFQITFIMDETSQSILSGLWHRPVFPGQKDIEGLVAFETVDSLPRSFPPADLYLALASPSGKVRFPKSLRRVEEYDLSRKGIPVNSKTIVLVQTVLGNTENPDSINPFALLQISGQDFRMLPAGLAEEESGLYSDYVAWQLRGKSRSEIANFIKGSLPSVKNKRDRQVIAGIVDGTLFAGSKPGLVYGVTAGTVKPQFETYLKGLAADARSSKKSYCLITPSGFSKGDVADNNLSGQIEVVALDQMPRPSQAKPETIYIVRTNGLPHPIFVGLMAYARPPPVLAGDGALSAAVILGRPFVMTQVAWNAKNIVNFRKKLLEQDNRKETRELMESIYSGISAPDLSRALQLEAHTSLYENLVYSLKGLSSSIFAAAQAVVSMVHNSSPLELLLPSLPQDWALRLDVILQYFVAGEVGALDAFGREYLKAPDGRRKQMLAQAGNVLVGDIEVSPEGKTTVRPPPDITGAPADVLDESKVGIAGRFVEIAPGEFGMGSPDGVEYGSDDETLHTVRLTHRIAMQAGPVTQRQFKLLMGRNPSNFKERQYSDGDFMRVNGETMNGDHPVEQVSWYDAIAYCNALSAVKGLKPAYVIKNIRRSSAGSIVSAYVWINGLSIYKVEGFRLPTEAEWEYAARAGTKGPYWFDAKELNSHSWGYENSDGRTHALGNPDHANPWGLQDMLGNVREWTQDRYESYPKTQGGLLGNLVGTLLGKKKIYENPKGPAMGSIRMVRGGSWRYDGTGLRSGIRSVGRPQNGSHDIGFRPVRSIR